MDYEASKPKLSAQASAALYIFYDMSRDRTYSGEHSLPNLLTNAIIEKAVENVYNNFSKQDLISIIKEVDSYYVSKKISTYNDKMRKRNGK